MSKRRKITGLYGAYINARRKSDSDRVTIWIEGFKNNDPTISALALDAEALDRLIRKLTDIRRNMKNGNQY